VFPKPGVSPTQEQINTMDWTLATLKEVLRLYSVVPVVTRVAVVRTLRVWLRWYPY
jgi:cytochrome P450